MKFSKPLVSALVYLASSVVVSAQTASPASQIQKDHSIKVILSRLELSAVKFSDSLNKSLIRSSVDQTASEDDINTLVPAFQAAIYDLGNDIISRDASATRAETVLRQASFIDAFMIHHRLARQVEIDWVSVRSDLDRLAAVYQLTWPWKRQNVASPYINGSARADTGLDQLIQRLETEGDKFRLSLTDAFDSTGYDKTTGEGRMNNDLRGLKKETDQIRNQFDSGKPIIAKVTRLLVLATPIDTYMRGNRLTNRVQDDWRTLYKDINTLAGAYKVSEIGRP